MRKTRLYRRAPRGRAVSGRLPVLEGDLQAASGVEFIDADAIHRAHACRQRFGVREQHRFKLAVVLAQSQFGVTATNGALLQHFKGVAKSRRREALAPDRTLERVSGVQRQQWRGERAVGGDHA